ncbi:MAG: cation transporter [Anaerolineae bacterium]|nr:cation transporter [Anaerolineae bacterium]
MSTTVPSLTRYAWLSILAAIATIGLKASAYFMTGSVGLLSDALESFVNLAAAIIALVALSVAFRPPDEDHEYGHYKIEYFSSGVEGTLILLAAASIAFSSLQRLLNPQPLEAVPAGLLVSAIASVINFAIARVLMRAGKTHHSITLEADAHHLMTDVWTSIGVIGGVLLVWLSGIQWLDPLIALFIAGMIVRSGLQLVRRSAEGLMDTAIDPDDRAALEAILDKYRAQGIDFHALRTRNAGARKFITVHVLVPGHWSVLMGHDLLEQVEQEMRLVLPQAHITTHLEPLGVAAALEDESLDRVT